MKVGSLVLCVTNLETYNSTIMKECGYSFPIISEMYVVRGFQGANNQNILLEEIVNLPLRFDDGEIEESGFGMRRFREVQPPMDFTALLEETEPQLQTI